MIFAKSLLLGCALVSLFITSACAKAELKKAPARISEYAIEPIFLKRQSKYALHRTLSESEMRQKLNQLFAAFIWAPSSYNMQPGRLVYALHGTKQWNGFLDLLVPFNKEWAKNAGVLVLVVSRKTYERNGKHCKTHSFDTGAATENLLLEAAAIGLVGHPIEGFDYAKARAHFRIPQGYAIECMIALGEPAPAELASKEHAEKDVQPASRKKVADFAFEGTFKAR